jgi:hypothetical protein
MSRGLPRSSLGFGPRWAVVGVLLPLLGLTACSINVNEARPARVLRGGEVQVSNVSGLVLPVGAVGDAVDPSQQLIDAAEDEEELTENEQRELVRSSAAIAIQGPGYNSHLEVGVGMGYRVDLAARWGSGIYALSARRGFDLGQWDASFGSRLGYNTGESWIPYADELNHIVGVGEMRRMDTQLFGQLGREWGEWFRLWFGVKGIFSAYSVRINPSLLRLPPTEINDHLWYAGGFVGAAIGYRYVFFLAEFMTLYTWADANIYGRNEDLSGLLFAPSWGFRLDF